MSYAAPGTNGRVAVPRCDCLVSTDHYTRDLGKQGDHVTQNTRRVLHWNARTCQNACRGKCSPPNSLRGVSPKPFSMFAKVPLVPCEILISFHLSCVSLFWYPVVTNSYHKIEPTQPPASHYANLCYSTLFYYTATVCRNKFWNCFV